MFVVSSVAMNPPETFAAKTFKKQCHQTSDVSTVDHRA
jgi:hypothetical protein